MESKKLWYWARATFYASIIMAIISTFDMIPFHFIDLLFSLGWVVVTHSAFILALFHLENYKNKGFAITSTIIMGIFLILFYIGLIILR